MDYQSELDLFSLLDANMSPLSTDQANTPIIDFNMIEEEASFSGGESPSHNIVNTVAEADYVVDYDPSKLSQFIVQPSETVQPSGPTLESTISLDMITIDPLDYTNLPILIEDTNQQLSVEWNGESVPIVSNTDGPCLLTQALQCLDTTPAPAQLDTFNPDFMAVALQQSLEKSQGLPLEHVTPVQVLDQEEKKPKKRGRKPKSETGAAPRQRRRQLKVKVYDLPPLDDEEREKKRKNAVNAKRHRDMAKSKMAQVENSLAEVIAERDQLRKQVEKLRQQEISLLKQLQHN